MKLFKYREAGEGETCSNGELLAVTKRAPGSWIITIEVPVSPRFYGPTYKFDDDEFGHGFQKLYGYLRLRWRKRKLTFIKGIHSREVEVQHASQVQGPAAAHGG